ncbi:hypothetical protein H5187_12820 [Pseudoalteromonas sp. SG44-1]|uniref:hypothetical protein n=1 Tax=Pseudoalteromonas sp. SG44-1 TaxID=2760964 RepID=UPI001600507A|nr:hypothetical protein [Pseudoalteromonas sp. SG44-1]MBB1418163.1 hypothetical protein [Pseudoalteromonas sp. SG44-1]
MYFDLTSLGIHFDSIIIWGLLMACLYNLLLKFTIEDRSSSPLVISLIMLVSYGLSYEFVDLNAGMYVYLIWVKYDFLTIIALLVSHKLLKLPYTSTLKYILAGLTINTLIFLGIHIDIVVFDNKNYWWFWSFYSIGITVIDFFMVVTLIFGKDWLHIGKLLSKRKQKKQITNFKNC